MYVVHARTHGKGVQCGESPARPANRGSRRYGHGAQRALRSSGVEVDLAATLQEGMAKLEGHTVVLADLNVPDGQSTTLLRRVREMEMTWAGEMKPLCTGGRMQKLIR